MDLFEEIKSLMATNQVFQGGFLLSVIGIVVAWSRNLPRIIWRFLKRKVMVTCDIQQGNYAYDSLTHWLAKHDYTEKTRWLSVSSDDDDYDYDSREKKQPTLRFTPAPGNHIFRYKGRWILLHRGRDKQGGQEGIMLGFHEYYDLIMLGRNRSILESLIKEAAALYSSINQEETKVYAMSQFNSWEELKAGPPRPLESVILEKDQKEALIEDISNFISDKTWYNKIGIPHRRGYFLHGPPGTGKTSTCMALAANANLDVAVLSMSDKWLSDSKLSKFINSAPRGAAFLLEDVDCIFRERESNEEGGVTFSGLLNVLDGALAQEGHIVFMTSNHIGSIDEALLRPGRSDVIVKIDLASKYQAREMFLRFFPNADTNLVDSFVNKFPEKTISSAKLQQHLVKYKDSCMCANKNAKELLVA